jgi:hypothetical protein
MYPQSIIFVQKKLILYSLFFIFILGLLLWKFSFFSIVGIPRWTMPAAFGIKILIGLLLFWLHIQTYGIDELSHDGETFMKEGKYLHDVFFRSPADFFKLLTGIGENEKLVLKHLYMTEYWSAGDLTLINDSKNVIRVHALIHFFSFHSVLIHLAVFCLISLLAIRNFYIAFNSFCVWPKQLFFWSFLLIPSVIFWTSSMLKEPLMLYGLSLFTYGLICVKNVWKKTGVLFLSFFILLAFKPYVLVCLLFSLGTYVLFRYLFQYKLIPTAFFIILGVTMAAFSLDKPRKAVVHHLTRKQFDFVNVGRGGLHVISDSCFYFFPPAQYGNLSILNDSVKLEKATDAFIYQFGSTKQPIPVYLKPTGSKWRIVYHTDGCQSYIETTPIYNSTYQLIKNIPEALINSMFRPFFWDPGSKLKYLSAIDLWFIWGLLLLAIFKRRKLNHGEKGIIFTMAVFSLLMLLLIGWTTPVLGAIARYRFPVHLAVATIAFILFKPIHLKSWKSMF